MGFDLNNLDQYTEKEGTRLQEAFLELEIMSINRSGQVIKLAIEKEGQLPLLTTFDQVYKALKQETYLHVPSCFEVLAGLDEISSRNISLIHRLYDSNCHLFKAMPLINSLFP